MFKDSKKKLVLLAALVSLGAAGTASAADLYIEPSVSPVQQIAQAQGSNWSGFYVGVTGGIAGYKAEQSLDGNYGVESIASDAETDTFSSFSFPLSIPKDLDSFDGVLGGHAGYNVQFHNAVFGVEADINWSSFDESVTFDGESASVIDNVSLYATNYTSTLEYSSSWDYFSTLRARLGLAHGNALFYVTGGLAYAKVDDVLRVSVTETEIDLIDDTDETETSTTRKSLDDNRFGLVLGAGAEAKVADNVSLRLEYLYVDLEDDSIDVDGVTYKADSDAHILRAGLNYHF